jgi:hypothetical protein
MLSKIIEHPAGHIQKIYASSQTLPSSAMPVAIPSHRVVAYVVVALNMPEQLWLLKSSLSVLRPERLH